MDDEFFSLREMEAFAEEMEQLDADPDAKPKRRRRARQADGSDAEEEEEDEDEADEEADFDDATLDGIDLFQGAGERMPLPTAVPAAKGVTQRGREVFAVACYVCATLDVGSDDNEEEDEDEEADEELDDEDNVGLKSGSHGMCPVRRHSAAEAARPDLCGPWP